MKTFPTLTAILGLTLATRLPAQEAAAPEPTQAEVAAGPKDATPKDPAQEAKRAEQERLATDNKLEAERLIQATSAMRAEVTQLKLERELMTEKLALATSKRQIALQEALSTLEAEKEKITEEGELSKIKSEKLSYDLKTTQTEGALDITRLQNDVARIEASEKRARFADAKPVFLQNPLKENGV